MRILLVSPAISSERRTAVKRLFSLYRSTLPYLAALVPVDADIDIIDESVHGPVDLEGAAEEGYDLAGISPQTASAPRGYEIADRLRQAHTTVVMGGVHVSRMPHEALRYSDAVVIGEAEGQWERVIHDHLSGKFRRHLRRDDRIYRSDSSFTMQQMPVPRWDLMTGGSLNYLRTVEITRGCPFTCSFCSIHDVYGKKYRYRPPQEVAAEIAALGARNILFATDNLSVNRTYAKALFRELVPLEVNWVAQAAIDFAPDGEFLQLARRSGCRGLIIGFESVIPESVRLVDKRVNQRFDYLDVVRRVHDNGIPVGGSFIFGFDGDTPGVAERTAEFVNAAKIDSVSEHILAPYPATPDYERLANAGRLLYRNFPSDWERYDTRQVVFKPRLMPVERLQYEYEFFKKEVSSLSSIARRSRLRQRGVAESLQYLSINGYQFLEEFFGSARTTRSLNGEQRHAPSESLEAYSSTEP